jgi:hypothetical protein
MRTLRLLLIAALGAVPATAAAQKTIAPAHRDQEPGRGRPWYVTAGGFATSLRNPFLREPGTEDGGGPELHTRQIVSTAGGRLGVGYRAERFGGEIAFSYWRSAQLDDFIFYQPGFQDSTNYSDVSVGLWQVDLVVLVRPVRGAPVWMYGLLGMGQQQKHYTLSNNDASFFNGRRELSEMNYTPGLGVRLQPLRQIAVFAEARWLPGDQSTTVPDEGCWIYTYYRRSRTPHLSVRGTRGTRVEACQTDTNFGHLLSAGVTINLP